MSKKKKQTKNKSLDNRAFIAGLFGATDSGKSTRADELIAILKPSRTIIWDFKREYTDVDKQFSRAGDLFNYIQSKGKRGRFRVSFIPSMDKSVREKQFEAVNHIVLSFGRMLYLVEELKFVTKPNSSPGSWSMLTLTGRAQEISIIGTSQRPASVDKDFFGNCTIVHSRRLNYDPDIVEMAKALRIRREQMARLKGHDYYERNNVTGKLEEKIFK
ncbi:MAG: hypothetical protein OEY09_10405 [Gammaproteobacteria bacterium]|nr:hypothetical protein [Gammaproteobacteria bacterium]